MQMLHSPLNFCSSANSCCSTSKTFLTSLAIFAMILGGMTSFWSAKAAAAEQPGPNSVERQRLQVTGSFRPVYYFIETRDRQGERTSDHTLNARLHLRAEYDITPDLRFRTRLAGRVSTDQDRMRFLLDDHTSPSGSYPAGTVTFDEFMLSWKASPEFTLTAGRFQARFPLSGFIPKGVDRYYSANLGIGHTDGVWVRWDVHPRWRLHLVGSHNSPDGSTHAARGPLAFDESLSRAGGFANFEHREQDGRWVQREISVSVLPQSFVRDEKTRTYAAISTRLMMRLPWQCDFFEYWVGGEGGYVPVAPTPASAGMAVDESRTLIGPSAVAWQVSAYANGHSGRHRFGILYGQVEPQWLISSSFRPNNTLSEVRYRYTVSDRLNADIRFRFRTDLFRPEGADYTRQDRDMYVRFTWRF